MKWKVISLEIIVILLVLTNLVSLFLLFRKRGKNEEISTNPVKNESMRKSVERDRSFCEDYLIEVNDISFIIEKIHVDMKEITSKVQELTGNLEEQSSSVITLDGIVDESFEKIKENLDYSKKIMEMSIKSQNVVSERKDNLAETVSQFMEVKEYLSDSMNVVEDLKKKSGE